MSIQWRIISVILGSYLTLNTTNFVKHLTKYITIFVKSFCNRCMKTDIFIPRILKGYIVLNVKSLKRLYLTENAKLILVSNFRIEVSEIISFRNHDLKKRF